MDLRQAAERLLFASRTGRPKYQVKVGGRLHDSAIGSIYVAHVTGLPSCILKTLDLQDQNVWALTKNNKRTTVRGLDAANVVYMTNRKSEAREFQTTWASTLPEGTLVAKLAFLNGGTIKRDGATRLALCNEYLNEALVGLVLSETMPKVPHFVRTYDAWIQNCSGFILQDHAGHALGNSMCELSLDEFKSVVMQTLVALAIAESVANFKHHDVHLDNVFVSRMPDSDPLRVAPSFTYTLGGPSGTTITIPHCGLLARLGDFGLSAITDPRNKIRYERLDYQLLDGAEVEWGQWTGTRDGMESYDIATFLSKFFLEQELAMCPKTHAEWAQGLYKALLSIEPTIQCSLIGRPHRGREGRITATQFLSHSVFDEWRAPRPGFETVLWPTS